MAHKIMLATHVTVEAWAHPADGDTMDDLIEKVTAAGNPVLAIDDSNQRVLIGFFTEQGST